MPAPPPLRPAEASITVAIEKAHAVIPSAWVVLPAGASGPATTPRSPETRPHAAPRGRPILAWAPGEDGLNSEKDNPQEPRPGDGRANPPAPGRLGPWGSSAPRGTPVAFPSLARESLVLRPEDRLNLTAATAGCSYPPPGGSPSGPVGPSGRTPTRISRSNRVGPSGRLFRVGLHEVAVEATFPLARRICAAQVGWNTSMEFR
jgi:hypothetical protein